MDTNNNERLFNTAIAFLRSKGCRITPPRETLIRTVLDFSAPFKAEEAWQRSREQDGLISLATVYRSLPLLVESGVLRELELGRDQKHYEVNRAGSPTASHIVCEDCNEVIEIESQCLILREAAVVNSLGFVPTRLALRIHANCQTLRRTGSCPRKAKA